jgi:hypothetical protein
MLTKLMFRLHRLKEIQFPSQPTHAQIQIPQKMMICTRTHRSNSYNNDDFEALTVVAGPFRGPSAKRHHKNHTNYKKSQDRGDRRGPLEYSSPWEEQRPWEEISLTKLARTSQSAMEHLDEIQHVKSKPEQRRRPATAWFARVARAVTSGRRLQERFFSTLYQAVQA